MRSNGVAASPSSANPIDNEKFSFAALEVLRITRSRSKTFTPGIRVNSLHGSRSVAVPAKIASETADGSAHPLTLRSVCEARPPSQPTAAATENNSPPLQVAPTATLDDSIATPNAVHLSSSLGNPNFLPVSSAENREKLLQQSSKTAYSTLLPYVPIRNDRSSTLKSSPETSRKDCRRLSHRSTQRGDPDMSDSLRSRQRLNFNSQQETGHRGVSAPRLEHRSQHMIKRPFTNGRSE